MRTKGMDMIHGSLWQKIPVFALTVAATGILEQLFNAADVAIIGRFTGSFGTVGVAAVGANTAIVALILNLFIGIALGSNVVIAHAVGAGDEKGLKKAVHTSIVMAFLGGILVTVIGEAAAGPLMGILHVPQEVLPWAVLYLRIYLLGMPVILLYNFEAAIFRSIGQTKIPLIALAFSGILNVGLNLFFVLGLKMKVDGVAAATVISNVCSALVLLIWLIRSHGIVRVRFRELRISRHAFRNILRIGLPAGIQSSVFSLSNIVIQAAINSLGTIVLAASSAAGNIEIMCYLVLNCFSQACTTFVGQNYGAGKPERCRKILKLSLIEDAIVYGLTLTGVMIFARSLLHIFNTNPEVIEEGRIRMCIILTAYLFSMVYEVMSGYLRGFGISVLPAILTTISVCGIRIVWINTYFRLHPSLPVIMTAYPISLAVTAILIFIVLIKKKPSRHMQM